MKAVIVAAGYGSRFLPASKTVPKEMFPVIDRPAIDFILQELRESGIDDILFITSRRKRALEDYVDREVELEQVFESEGAVDKQRTIAVPQGRFFFLRQKRMLGTGRRSCWPSRSPATIRSWWCSPTTCTSASPRSRAS